MLDPAYVRDNLERVRAGLRSRGLDADKALEELATLRQENAALRTQHAALEERIREPEARLGQNSANSSATLAH